MIERGRFGRLCACGVLAAAVLAGDAGVPPVAAPAGPPAALEAFQAPVGAPVGAPVQATAAPSASARTPGATPAPRAEERDRRPEPVRVPRKATGEYAVVAGEDEPPGRRGKVVRYLVEVERGLPFDPAEFADLVHRTLNDPRSWGGGGRMRFRRVDSGPVRFRVALSSPATTDRQCLPLRTGGWLSCWNGRRAVINAERWAKGVPGYGGDLTAYRQYVVNHEVGHALGHGHQACPGRGRRAPVMAQQTKSLGGCRPNPWPYPDR